MEGQFAPGVAVRDIMSTRETVIRTRHTRATVHTEALGNPIKAKALALSLGDTTVLLVDVDVYFIR